MAALKEEISRRRTFAIISHPDAGKTTLTEKFLLYGGAIAQAGAVKGKKNSRAAVSDWMEIEKQRGISVTSSVMQFQYEGFCINILDTPGHQDFSEDTYRTLMAADSAVMVIDGGQGRRAADAQAVQGLRDAPHPDLHVHQQDGPRGAAIRSSCWTSWKTSSASRPMPCNWPIGCGKEFQGVYDRRGEQLLLFSGVSGKNRADKLSCHAGRSTGRRRSSASGGMQQLRDDVELLGAGREFDMDEVRHGQLSARCSSARR